MNHVLNWNDPDALIEGLWMRLGRAVLPKGHIDLRVYRQCIVDELTKQICRRASNRSQR